MNLGIWTKSNHNCRPTSVGSIPANSRLGTSPYAKRVASVLLATITRRVVCYGTCSSVPGFLVTMSQDRSMYSKDKGLPLFFCLHILKKLQVYTIIIKTWFEYVQGYAIQKTQGARKILRSAKLLQAS